jgi:hypothetical protein
MLIKEEILASSNLILFVGSLFTFIGIIMMIIEMPLIPSIFDHYQAVETNDLHVLFHGQLFLFGDGLCQMQARSLNKKTRCGFEYSERLLSSMKIDTRHEWLV